MKEHSSKISKSLILILLLFVVGCNTHGPQEARIAPLPSGVIHAHFYDSGFRLADDNYNACFQASNGKIYYVLCSGSVDTGAQMYSFNPRTGKIQHAGDLTEAAGEKGLHAIPQGKGHSIFVEFNGKLYFATHVGYYNPPTPAGQELVGTPPSGYKPYPGGHFLSYDLTTGKFEDIARAPEGEGILTFAMDAERGRLYGITWPSGLFLRYDMHKHELRNFGPISQGGEKGTPGSTFRVLCRSLVITPEDGSVYFTTADGDIFQYRCDADLIEKVHGCDLRKDFFGCLDPSAPGTMGYNWRQAFWYAPESIIYGVHGRSGYLFRFDPRTHKVEVLDRLVSNETRESGMYDRFKYGHLGFTLGSDGHTIYYLTGAPPKSSGDAEDEDIHLVTYDIPSKKCVDYGVLQMEDGLRPFFAQSIAIGRDGMIYTVAKVRKERHVRVDLLSFPNPVRGR